MIKMIQRNVEILKVKAAREGTRFSDHPVTGSHGALAGVSLRDSYFHLTMKHLAILLPITSRGKTEKSDSSDWINRVPSKLAIGDNAADVVIILGVDETDDIMHTLLPQLKDSFILQYPLIQIVVEIFPRASLNLLPKGPICWMWNRLAQIAVTTKADAFVLLGDDTVLYPQSWPSIVCQRFASDPSLHCLLLNDKADPGYPSFPVVRASLLAYFNGQFLPDIFINQGGDPFFAELSRRLGGLDICQEVCVHNQVGGIQLPDDDHYVPPRYPRAYPTQGEVFAALKQWTERGRSAARGGKTRLTVDVLVPSYRANIDVLEGILTSCFLPDGSGLEVDVRFGIVIDDPNCSQEVRSSLLLLQRKWLGCLKLRFNAENLGASGTRNKCLEESLAECVIFLDDDVIPSTGLIKAYVTAFRNHPEEQGFAGPTLLPRPPTLAACGLHLSDVSFFWDAPLTMARVPWAVTANVAFRNTTERFDLRFPKTGGGEDIDFCLRSAPRGLLAVPDAIAHHPLWNGGKPCFLRFALWSYGDGALIGIYKKRFTYKTAPNAVEMILVVFLVQMVTLPLSLASIAPVSPPSLWSPISILLAEVGMDIVMNLGQERLAKHPTPSFAMLLVASTYATLVRTISETGRIVGHFKRGEPHLFTRFDWFCGQIPEVKREETLKSYNRMAGYILGIIVCHALVMIYG
jgi:glycosyltransferase involved in cell wall biosynthesis